MKYNNIREFLADIEERMDELKSEGMAGGSPLEFSTAVNASRGEPFDSVDAMESLIYDAMGAEGFLSALTRAMDYDSKEDLYKYIIRVYEIEEGGYE